MKDRFKNLANRMLSAAGPTFKRFWVSVIFTLAFTGVLIMSTSGPYPFSVEILNRLAASLLAGILVSWCAILFWEALNLAPGTETGITPLTADKKTRGDLIALGTSLGATATSYVLLGKLSFVETSRHAGICLFLFLLFLVIPYIRKRPGFDMYVVKLFSQAVLSILFSAVLFIGLVIITFTISQLFSLNLPSRIYLQLWLLMAGLLAPFLFMAGIPGPGANIHKREYPKVLSNLVIYVLSPLFTAYTIILYLYFTKILVIRQWPTGLVAHLVLWYSALGVVILYFLWPLASDNKWAQAFPRYFIKAVVPLLAMMFFSLGVRIKSYGMTENRYYVVMLGLWVLGSLIYLNLAQKKNKALLPLALAVIAFLSVTGPWSSFSMSKRSQNLRLERLCAPYEMIVGGTLSLSNKGVSRSDQEEMAAVIRYFSGYHSLEDIRLLPSGFTLAQFEEVFGFPEPSALVERGTRRFHYDAPNQSLEVDGYQYLFDYTSPRYTESNKIRLSQKGVWAQYDGGAQSITLDFDDLSNWSLSFPQFVHSLLPQYDDEDFKESNSIFFLPEHMTIEDESANMKIKIVITALEGELDVESEKASVYHVGFIVLVGGL